METYETNPIVYLVKWWSHQSPAMAFATLFGALLLFSLFIQAVRNAERRNIKRRFRIVPRNEWLVFVNTLKLTDKEK